MLFIYSTFYSVLLSSINPYLIHWRLETWFSFSLNPNFCQFPGKYKIHKELRAQPQHSYLLIPGFLLILFNYSHAGSCNHLKLSQMKNFNCPTLWPQLPDHLPISWSHFCSSMPNRHWPQCSSSICLISLVNLIYGYELILTIVSTIQHSPIPSTFKFPIEPPKKKVHS